MNSKIYRCGWCGCPTNENGNGLDATLQKRVISIIEKYGDGHTQKTNGYCCAYEFAEQQKVQITRDMAIDAGDRSLEGQWIEW